MSNVWCYLLVASGIFTLVQPTVASAEPQEWFPLNEWVRAEIPDGEKATAGYHRNRHAWFLPVRLQPGQKYTLLVRWTDGNMRLATVSRAHPTQDDNRNTPRNTTGVVSVNVGGNNIPGDRLYKRNFTVDPDSPKDVAYVSLAQNATGIVAEIMIKHPAETDEVVTAVVRGQRFGQVISQPLHLNTEVVTH